MHEMNTLIFIINHIMNKLLLLFLFSVTISALHAQTKALTESGKQVTLYDDGTWKYLTDNQANAKPATEDIKLNSTKFSKSANQTFLLKSNKVNVAVFLDPVKWTATPRRDNEADVEYHFSDKSDDGRAMMITEKTPVPLENMPNVALINAQRAAVDAKITKREYRIVNGTKVLYLEMAATIQGMKILYLGYYFSDSHGTTQLLCYTSEALYSEVSKDLEAFLNGFTVLGK